MEAWADDDDDITINDEELVQTKSEKADIYQDERLFKLLVAKKWIVFGFVDVCIGCNSVVHPKENES